MDTSPEVAARQQEMLANMTIGERADLIVSLCEAVTEAAIAGIKLEYPGATEGKLRSELLLRRYGADFVASLPPELR